MTKKRLNDKLGEFFEIENDMVEVESSPKQELINPEKIETRTEDITDDYEFRRQTLYGLVDNGQEALQHLIMVAKESEHPRAYEVVGQMLKTTADLVGDLTKLQGEMNKIETTKGGPSKVVNNNSVFVGDTNALLEMLKGKNRE
jgi:hypothetical protein